MFAQVPQQVHMVTAPGDLWCPRHQSQPRDLAELPIEKRGVCLAPERLFFQPIELRKQDGCLKFRNTKIAADNEVLIPGLALSRPT